MSKNNEKKNLFPDDDSGDYQIQSNQYQDEETGDYEQINYNYNGMQQPQPRYQRNPNEIPYEQSQPKREPIGRKTGAKNKKRKKNIDLVKAKVGLERIEKIYTDVKNDQRKQVIEKIQKYNELMDSYIWTKPDKHFVMNIKDIDEKEAKCIITDEYEEDEKDKTINKIKNNGGQAWTTKKGEWKIKDDDSMYD